MLRVQNLVSCYGRIQAVKHVSLHVDKREIVALIGANGAGKTTILRTISGLMRPAQGKVFLQETDVTGLPADQIVALGMAMVPEGRLVFAPMSVRDNLTLGAYQTIRRDGRVRVQQALERVCHHFPRLEERQKQLAGTLSGGEQQMLAIARALMSRPRVLLLDEPSMGLAPMLVKEIFAALGQLRDEGTTILLVEQNAQAALELADRGYVLETGQVILEGPSQELLNNREVTRAYLGKQKRDRWELSNRVSKDPKEKVSAEDSNPRVN